MARKQASKLLGKVEIAPLAGIRANDWNPNTLTPAMMASLRRGFREDGWVVSQALLVWRTNEQGETKNLVIDGEHRLRVALELGYTQGPVVFLDNLPEAEAKALTIKLDAKRGKFDKGRLRDVVADLVASDLVVDAEVLGFSETEFQALLTPEALAPETEEDALPSGKADVAKTLHLIYDAADMREFKRLTRKASVAFEREDVSQVVLEALRQSLKGRK